MNYAQSQRNPGKNLMGITFVVIFHLVLVYGLVNGLARKVVEVIQQPLETKIIEEIAPPPPPEPPPPPPPKLDIPPPPSFVPPPEVSVAPPPTPPQNAISATTAEKPVVAAQPRPVEVPAPVAAPAPAPAAAPAPPPSVVGLCSNAKEQADSARPKFERVAEEEGIASGARIDLKLEVVIGPGGEIKGTRVIKSSSSALNNIAISMMKRLKCRGQGQDVTVPYEVSFTLEDG